MSAEKPSISLQDRDVALLRGLFESRVMTARHVAAIYFAGAREAAKKRLQKLKGAGYVTERARRAYEPSLLLLAPKGLALLRNQGVLAEYPSFSVPDLARRARVSALTVNHELEVMDVKAAFHMAVARLKGFSIVEFNTWPQLNEFEARRPGFAGGNVPVRPDGFIRLHEEERDGGLSEHALFLEVDRSTEKLETIVARAGCYHDYYRSGGFAARNGGDRSAYREYPFRVLIAFKTAERRNNVAERLLHGNPPVFALVHLSTLEEVKNEPTAAIWIRPLDYRNATEGWSSGPGNRFGQRGYQRQTARDMLVEQRVKKQLLFADGPERKSRE